MSIFTRLKLAWSTLWRLYPVSVLLLAAAGWIMVTRSAAGSASPLEGHLGWFLVVSALVTWMVGVRRFFATRNRPPPQDETPFLVEGQPGPWPTTRLLAPTLVGALCGHVAVCTLTAQSIKHLDAVRDAPADTCTITASRVVDPSEDPPYISLRVRTPSGVRSGWMKLKDKLQSAKEGRERLKNRYPVSGTLSCFRSGPAPYQIAVERPDDEDLWSRGLVVLASLYTALLLSVRMWRSWAYRETTLPKASTPSYRQSTAVSAATAALGLRSPAGFRAHRKHDGSLVVRVVRVGSEELDAFLSIFNTILCAGLVFAPAHLLPAIAALTGNLSQAGYWVTTFMFLMLFVMIAGASYLLLPRFARHCAGTMTITLTDTSLTIARRTFLSRTTEQCSRHAVQCVTQVQDGGFDSDSFPSWGLMVKANETLELLHREEAHRSRWLGPVIAAWAASPYHHAGPYRSDPSDGE